MALVDLKRTKEDKAEEATEVAAGPSGDDYPYGTCLNLDTDELDKLGISKLPEVGDEYHIHAIGKVTRVSSSATEGQDESNGISVQITMMEMVHEDEEPGEVETPAAEEAEERGNTILASTYRGKR